MAKTRSRALARLLMSLALACGAVSVMASPATARSVTAPPPPALGFVAGLAISDRDPTRLAGANDWNCRPSPGHPYPVVLVHATGANMALNWVALSPMLAERGHCVFAFNYGMNPKFSNGRTGGMGDIARSARTMQAFVDRVLAVTGAEQVDVVGHSQGGMMPNYYIKRLGGAPKVRTFVALSPSNHGLTLNGLFALYWTSGAALDDGARLWRDETPGVLQQFVDSPFQRELWADGDTVPGPRYVVIATARDIVATPYANGFLAGANVTNILIQNQCPASTVGHIGMLEDYPTLQNVINQLGPNDAGFRPICSDYGLGI